jgi:alcohol dehydrogenase (cytochrome c)
MFVCAAETAMTLEGGGPELDIPESSTGASFTGGGIAGPSKPQSGIVAAMDVTTNTLVWRYRWQDTCYSGFMATAGDLLFVGRNDGRLTALDTDTGHQLWAFQTGAGMNAPVTTFEYEGTQYVAAYSAGNLFAGSYHGDSLWLFSLEGNLDETTEGDTALSLTQTAALDVEVVFATGPADLASGELLYKQSCLPCHGEDGKGGHGGGITLESMGDINDAITIVTRGRNNMPTFFGALTPEQIRDVSTYVVDELMQ